MARSQAVEIFATDAEIYLRTQVPNCEVQVPGETLLSVDRFGPILRENYDEALLIEADGTNVKISGLRSEFKLPAANPDEYPDDFEFTEGDYFRLPARLLAQLIRRTVFATDTESSRYALGGVLFEIQDGRVVAVSTDGRRLAKMEGPVESVGRPGLLASAIVSARALTLIERLIAELDGDVDVALHDNDLFLRTPQSVLKSRLVEGRFPKWRDVVSHAELPIQVELAVGPLLSAVRQAAVVTDKESRAIDFTFGSGNLELTAETADVGSSRVLLPIAYDGPEVVMALDNRYITDFLRVLEPETSVTFMTSSTDAAAEIHVADGYLYMLMPMERRRRRSRQAEEVAV